MKRLILSLDAALHAIVRRAAALTLALMFLTVMIQVIARYAFSAPPVWTEDVARYMMVWTGLTFGTASFKTFRRSPNQSWPGLVATIKGFPQPVARTPRGPRRENVWAIASAHS